METKRPVGVITVETILSWFPNCDIFGFSIDNFGAIKPEKQSLYNTSYFPKRTPENSEIDINKNLSDQFDLIRVCDVERFPAFFYKDGQKFNLIIHKDNE